MFPCFPSSKGECLVVFGPNGSGKSTLASDRLAPGKARPGTDFLPGERGQRRNGLDVRRRFVLLLQRPYLFRGNVEKNVLFGLKVRGTPKPEMRKRLDKAARMFSLGPLLGRDARKLSGGEAQRVNLARAFILEPDILFLDEPFSALDAPTREDLIHELKRVLKETGQTTVFVTHHREEAAFLATRRGRPRRREDPPGRERPRGYSPLPRTTRWRGSSAMRPFSRGSSKNGGETSSSSSTERMRILAAGEAREG